jgi:Tfp pilus assembly protein PilN
MISNILSIDLQSDTLTAVLLENDVNRDIIASTILVSADKTAEELITELTTSIDCSNCRCVLSLGASFFTFRNLTFPFSDRKSIDKILPFELEEGTAAPIDTMVIDAMVNPDKDGGSEVISAMIDQSLLADLHSALTQAEIPPEIITLSGLPNIEELRETGQVPDEFIFLDLRLESACLFFISHGKIQLIRPLPLSPLPGFRADFSMKTEDEELIIQGLEYTAETFSELALSVKQTLAPFPLQTTKDKIPVYLDGTARFATKTKTQLEDNTAFNRPCLLCGQEVGILPLPIQLPENTKKHAQYLCSCLSLGNQADKLQNSFNFCKGDFASHNNLTEYRQKAWIAGGAILAILIFSLAYLIFDTASLKKERIKLTDNIHAVFKTSLPDTKRIVAPVQQLQVAIDEIKKSTATGNNALSLSILNALREISTLIPESLNVQLLRMVYERSGLRLTGITDSFNTVNSMKKNLEQSPFFPTVTISSTKQNPKDNSIRFELKIETAAGTE